MIKKFFVNKVKKILRQNGYVITMSYDNEKRKVLKLIDKIKTEVFFLLSDNEAYQLYALVKSTQKIKGDIAEVGTFEGGSSKLICEAKSEKKLFLFDTFEGLQDVKTIDSNKFHIGQYKATFENVKKYLKKYKNVFIYKGFFPKTAKPIQNNKFCFIHLDVDTYQSTKKCLEFFYTRMSKGGVLISHDYVNSKGVKKAFDEFFKNKPEPIIPLIDRQCMFQKL